MNAPVRIKDHFPVAPEKQLEEIVLYDGATITGSNSVALSQSILDFELVVVYGSYEYQGTFFADAREFKASELLTNKSHTITQATAAGSATSYVNVFVIGGESTDTSLKLNATSAVYVNAGVNKVVGYRKRYATENNSVIIPVNGGNNVTTIARYEVKLPPSYYESDGSVKEAVELKVQLNINGSVFSGFADVTNGHIYNSGSSQHIFYGAEVKKAGDKVYVYTAGYDQVAGSSLTLVHAGYNDRPWDVGVNQTSAPCQVIATLNDRTSISVPVGDKGYGGLRKDTVDTTAIADFTVPNAIDFNLPLVSSPLKVTQNVSNNRLSLSQIGIWGSSGSINLTFDSGNNGREIIADIYNETKGQVALEKPEYVARNQLGITIPISVDVLEILTSGDEYSLRVRSNDVFTNVKVGKCWWDVTLNAPL